MRATRAVSAIPTGIDMDAPASCAGQRTAFAGVGAGGP